MLNLLRKLRRQEMTKSKYFTYAVGEIFLVVVGILLALQINNWNEDRKTNLKARTYKKTILNDLIQDTLAINSLIEEIKPYKKNITNYFNYIGSLRPSSNNLRKLSDSLSKVRFFYRKHYPINSSFKEMESSGKENLLNKEQRDFLLKLLSEHEEINIITENQLEVAINNKDKSDELSGFPYDIYRKLNAKQSRKDQIQSMIHLNLWLNAVNQLYYYLETRGERIKTMIKENIYLFEED